MNDLLPAQSRIWQYLEKTVEELLCSYGYEEIRFPIVEQTDLFKRSIGEVTDIVEKEMYTFADRNDESITLRPEGTAGCVRACLQNSLIDNHIQRLWYGGPMFRYERPQKGRLRQFHQIGVEVFGLMGPDIDAEMIFLTSRLWQRLGLSEHTTLELNSIGSLYARDRFKKALVEYLRSHADQLDKDSQRRLDTNPLRILDSKSLQTQEILEAAPDLHDFLDGESRQHFEGLQALLAAAKIPYRVNSRLVRGLDYYGKTVFEWVTDRLGAQGTICAGGRYDGLVEQLGGKPTPAVGFAMGIERLALLLDTTASLPDAIQDRIDAYFVAVGNEQVQLEAVRIAEQLREQLPELRLLTHCGDGSFKSQMKKADKSGAQIALILGEDEVSDKEISLKPLRLTEGRGSEGRNLGKQRRLAVDTVATELAGLLGFKD